MDDGSTFLTRFDNGIMGTFVSSRNGTARGNYQRIEVYGEKGGLVYSWEDKDNLEVSLGDDARRYKWSKIPVPERFAPRDGTLGWTENVSNFIDAMQIPYIAPSLGGVESLIEQPAIISYYDKSPEERAELGIKDNLVRFAIGIEDTEDILNDLEQALSVL